MCSAGSKPCWVSSARDHSEAGKPGGRDRTDCASGAQPGGRPYAGAGGAAGGTVEARAVGSPLGLSDARRAGDWCCRSLGCVGLSQERVPPDLLGWRAVRVRRVLRWYASPLCRPACGSALGPGAGGRGRKDSRRGAEISARRMAGHDVAGRCFGLEEDGLVVSGWPPCRGVAG